MPLDRRLNRRSLRWGLMRDAVKCHRHTANITAAPDLMAETSGKRWSSYGIWAWDGQPDQTGLLRWFRVLWGSCPHPRVLPNPHGFHSSVEHRRSTFVGPELFGSKHSTKYLLLRKTSKPSRFGPTWNDDRMIFFFFAWTIALNQLKTSLCLSFYLQFSSQI